MLQTHLVPSTLWSTSDLAEKNNARGCGFECIQGIAITNPSNSESKLFDSLWTRPKRVRSETALRLLWTIFESDQKWTSEFIAFCPPRIWPFDQSRSSALPVVANGTKWHKSVAKRTPLAHTLHIFTSSSESRNHHTDSHMKTFHVDAYDSWYGVGWGLVRNIHVTSYDISAADLGYVFFW